MPALSPMACLREQRRVAAKLTGTEFQPRGDPHLTDTSHIVAGNAPQTQPENRAFYPALDGMRGLAFIMVFLQHYEHVPWMWTGVDLFFVLSGFLITGILFDSIGDPHRVRKFYVRRTLRIFPLYYGLFLVLLLLTPLVHWQWSWTWLAWLLYVGNYLRFLQPYVTGTPWQRVADAHLVSPGAIIYLGHLWSLCIEEQFYLLWPWIVFSVRSRRALLWVCGTCVLLVPLLRVIVQHHASQNLLHLEFLYRLTPFRIDALLLGGLAALWLRGPQRETLLSAVHWLFWTGSAVVFTYIGLATYLNWTFDVTWRLTWGLAFIDLYALTMLLMALQPGSVLYRVFSLGPLRWLGRISYGAYVFHDIYHGVISDSIRGITGRGHPLLNDNLTAAIAFVTTLVIASLSYRYFESPFLDLKERWTVRIQAETR